MYHGFIVPPKELEILGDPFSILLVCIISIVVLNQESIDGGQPCNVNLMGPIREMHHSLEAMISLGYK